MDATPDEVRLAPLPPKEWPPEMKDALSALRPPDARHELRRSEGGSKGLNVLGLFAHHPALAKAFLTFNGHILSNSTLSPRQRELVVLRVAALRRSAYEWAQHVAIAEGEGITAEEIERVRSGAGAAGWSPLEQALLRAADDLIAEAKISDATWAALSEELDRHQLMDLVFTVGAYETVAMAFRTFGVPLDDDLPRS